MRQEGLHTEEPVILQYVGLFAGDYVHVAFGAGLDCNCMRNKSNISYLKNIRAFDVLIHSSQTLLVSDSVGTTSS